MLGRLRLIGAPYVLAAGLVACGGATSPGTSRHDQQPRSEELASVDSPFPTPPEPLGACPLEAAVVLPGTPGPDTLQTTLASACIDAGAGDDVIDVKHGRTSILAGPGDDAVQVDADIVFVRVALGDGDDTLFGFGGATAAWAGPGHDTINGGPGPDVIDGDDGEDVLDGGKGDDLLLGGRGEDILSGGLGSDIIEGGVDSDTIDGGTEDDLLYGDEGDDHLLGGPGADLLEGGGGLDYLEGGPDADRLLAQGGDDWLEGGKGPDLLIPGAGVDVALGGDGDDMVVVLHACQVERGERLDGGDGHDTLLTPLSLSELASLGVDVSGFETIREFPADGFECDPQDCDCGVAERAPRLRRSEMCDYSSADYGLTSEQRLAAEGACNELLDTLPSILDGLPIGATEDDVEASLATKWHDAFLPTRIAQFSYPHEPGFPPTNPLPNIDSSVPPCDMPQLDLHIGVARGGINNCYGTEKEEINEALVHAKMMLFRMRQQIDAVHDAPSESAAKALWNMGSNDGWRRFSLSNWFGTYDADRVSAVRSTVAQLEDIFYADDDPLVGLRHNVQCYHRLKWWQYILYGRLNPLTIAFKTVANSCFYPGEIAHASFSIPVVGRVNAVAAYYPFESIELCETVFDHDDWDPPEVLGGVIMHELLHFHQNTMGKLKDRHGSADDGICDGPCYLAPFSEALADEAPNTAVVNIDNYRLWANGVHTLYSDGYCDDSDPGICLPSSCCGDGVLQTHLSENCDDSDFGALSCLSVAGLTEGDLSCSADCQIITSEACHGSCGNGAIDPALAEDCDGADFGGVTCASLFGSEMGSLGCTASCVVDASACEGVFPVSYFECGVDLGSTCLDAPETCHTEAGAGTCTGGPCTRTDPGARAAGQVDPHAEFHPRGNFRDADGYLYRCEDGPSGPRTCIDEEGYGVCRECGTGEGQSMLGCPCVASEECGVDLACFGGQYPHGGFCWPADSGPPEFQCLEGGCGQDFWGPGGGAYCEHYPPSGPARCMPQRCQDIPARACAEQDLICASNGVDCANECETSADCSVGWPLGTICSNNVCETP